MSILSMSRGPIKGDILASRRRAARHMAPAESLDKSLRRGRIPWCQPPVRRYAVAQPAAFLASPAEQNRDGWPLSLHQHHRQRRIMDKSEEVRRIREDLGLTVNEFASRVGVHPRTVSRWERDDNVQPRGEAKRAIQALLKGQYPARQRASTAQTADIPNLLSDDAFFTGVAEWVSDWEKWSKQRSDGNDSCDFFFFGPDDLPVFDNQNIQQFWTANLTRNINYHIFWMLDVCESSTRFLTSLRLLEKIANEAVDRLENVQGVDNQGPGRCKAIIRLHGVVIQEVKDLPEHSMARAIRDMYEALRDHYSDKKKTVLRLQPIVNVTKATTLESEKSWITILRLGAMVPLMLVSIVDDLSVTSSNRKIKPVTKPLNFSARRLADVSLQLQGNTATGWVYHDNRFTTMLIDYLDLILKQENTETVKGT